MVRLGFGGAGSRRPVQSFDQCVRAADALRDAKDAKAAAPAYAAALDLWPARTDIRVQYANMLKDSGDPETAITHYLRCLREEPENWDTLLQLARAELQLDRYDDVRDHLEKAVRLQPDATAARDLLDQLDTKVAGDANPWDSKAAEIGLTAARTFARQSGLRWRSTNRATLAAIASGIHRTDGHLVPARPAVSVVVLLRGQTLAALSCLQALSSHRSRHSFEVLVLDDASPRTWATDIIGTMDWLRYERQEERLGMAAAMALARELARGRRVVLLDATTRVCDGWLDNLVASRAAHPLAGRSLDNIVGADGVALAPGLDNDRGTLLLDKETPRAVGTLLIVDHYIPEPDRDAGSRSMLDMMASMQVLGWTVAFWPVHPRPDSAYGRQLRAAGVTLLDPAAAGSFEDWFACNVPNVDLVLLSRPPIALPFMQTIQRLSSVPVMFYGHDIHAARMRAEARVTGSATLEHEAATMEENERRLWRLADVTLYPSEEEAAAARILEPRARVCPVVPFCFDDVRASRPPPASKAILFVAGFAHTPNVDAACWFVRDVMPSVHAAHPEAVLWIVGSHPTPAVRDLSRPGIDVVGTVTTTELQARYDAARLAVVPLRFGAGVKLKVVEALHEGLPLVTTPVGAQGLPGLADVATVVEGADEMVRALNLLLGDDAACARHSERQRSYAARMFSRRASVDALSEVLAAVSHRVVKPAFERSRNAASEAGFLRDAAAREDISDADLIYLIYVRLLGREPDHDGLARYREDIRSGSLTRVGVVDHIASSDEFRRRAAPSRA